MMDFALSQEAVPRRPYVFLLEPPYGAERLEFMKLLSPRAVTWLSKLPTTRLVRRRRIYAAWLGWEDSNSQTSFWKSR
jgi:hypothetical protein